MSTGGRKENSRNSIAIIGATGAGKTVLAVGLKATSTESFTVDADGDETKNYLQIRQSELQDGSWPAATLQAENLDLHLKLHADGTRADIVFREYMGERMNEPNYVRDVIGTPQGAIILFNPGMTILRSAESRNRMIDNIKEIAGHLAERDCTAVAFVVTASDRLASDLAGFREEFEQYVAEVTNHLVQLQKECALEWKRFDVTVSGELADQNRPRLAAGENNTTHEPFLWILQRIRAKARRRLFGKIAFCAAVAAVLGAAAWGGLCWRGARTLGAIERDAAAAEANLENAWKIADEASVTSNLAVVANCRERILRTLKTPTFGACNRERAAELETRLAADCDLWLVRSLRLEYKRQAERIEKDPLQLPPGWSKRFDDLLKTTSPGEPKSPAAAELAELNADWATNRPGMETKWQTAKLRSDTEERVVKLEKAATADSIAAQLKTSREFPASARRDYPLATNAGETMKRFEAARKAALDRYCGIVANWSVTNATPPVAGDDLQQKLKTELLGKVSDDEFQQTRERLVAQQEAARKAWDAYQFPKQADEHVKALSERGLPARDNGGAALPQALKESLAFLNSAKSDFPTIDANGELFNTKMDAVAAARKEAIDAYADSVSSKWSPESTERPKAWEPFPADSVTEAEAKDLQSVMDERLDRAQRSWDATQFTNQANAHIKALSERGLPARDNGGAALPQALKASLAFLEGAATAFPTIDANGEEFNTKMDAVAAARKAAIDAYADSVSSKWSPESAERPKAWVPFPADSVTEAEAKDLQSVMAARLASAQRSWDTTQFTKQADAHIKALSKRGESPAQALKDSLAFKDAIAIRFPTIDWDGGLCNEKKSALASARRAALRAYADSLAGWNVDGDTRPQFDAQRNLDTVLADAVTETEAEDFKAAVEERLDLAVRQWEANQLAQVQKFIRENDSMDLQSVIREYGEFIDEHPGNPNLGTLHDWMEGKLWTYFKTYLDDYRRDFRGKTAIRYDSNPNIQMQNAQSKFNTFRQICHAVAGGGFSSSPLANSPIVRFAKSCVATWRPDTGFYQAFLRKCAITRIEARFDKTSLDSDCKEIWIEPVVRVFFWDFGQFKWMPQAGQSFARASLSRTALVNGYCQTLWEGRREFYANPFMFATAAIKYGDEMGNTFSTNESCDEQFRVDLRTGNSDTIECPAVIRLEHYGRGNSDNSGTLTVWITVESEGGDILSLWEDATR